MQYKIWYIIRRELHFIFSVKKSVAFYCLVFPFIIFSFMLLMFSSKVIRKVPTAVVDDDRTAMSREFIRALDASPYIDVKFKTATFPEAKELFEQLKIFAIVYIERDFQKNILDRKGSNAAAFINYQFVIPAGNAAKGIAGVAESFSYKYKNQMLGLPEDSAISMADPVIPSETALFNPETNYIYYLVLAQLSAVWQLFINFTVTYSMLSEFKERRGRKIRGIIRRSPFKIIASKISVYIAIFTCSILTMLGILFIFFTVPMRGNFLTIAAGAGLFAFYTASISVLAAGYSGNMKIALTVASLFFGPSYAYFGVSMPQENMTLFARVWSSLLPGTHFNRILINTAIRGAPSGLSAPDMFFLFFMGALVLSLGCLHYKNYIERAHGKHHGQNTASV
ncbi:MAG: ABC transporter permease [Elusimicrobia bacterium]|nr:ABC transporter permease [Elusimicrobiota bacterium]